ncbi:MAG: SPOR domain-containing protein [Gammaproteobacteria bacterium]
MKERLTGAIILVVLLVLLVPELLTGPESRQATKPAGADGAQLRSYTIDLQDDAANRPPPPSAPTATASDEPVGLATPEPEPASPPVANVSPSVDEATRASGKPMGSGADPLAAAPDQPPAVTAKPGEATAPSAEDDKPRSAFGPNAVVRAPPEKPASRAAAPKAESAKPPPAAKPESSKPEPTRLAAAKPEDVKGGSKGWAVQLGVFGSRENADRLAKQVKGGGFAVLINETSGKDGKKLYWVRVGPEADASGAAALSARLKAAGHRDARVVSYP